MKAILSAANLQLDKRLFFLILVLAWMGFGLVGRDPWKPDEAYTWGLVYHILETGDFVIPQLGGEPFMEKPPLYFVTAAISARLFSPWLALHDAGRLATGFYIGLSLLFVWLTARELWGKSYGRLAVFILMGCFGALVVSHQMITDTALLAGHAVALYGLSLSLRRAVLAGITTGTGVGIGFLSKGLVCPGLIGVIALFLPLFFRPWRTGIYFRSLAIALLAALPWLLVWPYSVYQHAPALFWEWFWVNNLGRFFGFAHLGPINEPVFYLKTLLWYAWPAWPLALWVLWQRRNEIQHLPQIQLLLTAFLVMLLVLSLSADGQSLYALPILLPLALLACTGIHPLKEEMSRLGNRLAISLFGMGILFLWLGWVALITGAPAGLARFLQQQSPSYTPTVSIVMVTLAVIFSLGWFIVVMQRRRWRLQEGMLRNWVMGLVTVWVLISTLWVPWLNETKSYRAMIADLQRHLPAEYDCIASKHLSEAQRALLEYYGDIYTKRVELTGKPECDLYLVEGRTDSIGDTWQQIWQGHRPSDKEEHFWLFKAIKSTNSYAASS